MNTATKIKPPCQSNTFYKKWRSYLYLKKSFSTVFCLLNPLYRTLQRLLGMPSLGVKALIINAADEVLLVEHTYIDGWHLPGGGVSKGESPKEAVIREVREETGLVALDPQLFAIYSHKINGAD